MTLADFCPFVQEFTWKGGAQESEGDKEGRGTRCDNSDNNPGQEIEIYGILNNTKQMKESTFIFYLDNDDNYALEHYGSQSRCFQQVGCLPKFGSQSIFKRFTMPHSVFLYLN